MGGARQLIGEHMAQGIQDKPCAHNKPDKTHDKPNTVTIAY